MPAIQAHHIQVRGLMQILHHLAHPVVHAPVHAFVCRNMRSVMRAFCTVRVDSTTGHSDDVLSSLLPVAGPRTGRASFDRIRLSSEHICPGVDVMVGGHDRHGSYPRRIPYRAVTCV